MANEVTQTFIRSNPNNVTSNFSWKWSDSTSRSGVSGATTGTKTISFDISSIPDNAVITEGSISWQYGTSQTEKDSLGVERVTLTKSAQINTSGYPTCNSSNIVSYFKSVTTFSSFGVRLSAKVGTKYLDVGEYVEGSSSATATFGTVTLTLTYTVKEEEATVNYGNNGAWQKCKVYYGDNGTWKQVKVYYGDNGTWKQVK